VGLESELEIVVEVNKEADVDAEAVGLESELEIVVEVNEEADVDAEVSSTTSRSIRSMVSCEFPLGTTWVSFSFLIIIS